jgi:hypothetical protein
MLVVGKCDIKREVVRAEFSTQSLAVLTNCTVNIQTLLDCGQVSSYQLMFVHMEKSKR